MTPTCDVINLLTKEVDFLGPLLIKLTAINFLKKKTIIQSSAIIKHVTVHFKEDVTYVFEGGSRVLRYHISLRSVILLLSSHKLNARN